jgi:hypothetical protein
MKLFIAALLLVGGLGILASPATAAGKRSKCHAPAGAHVVKPSKRGIVRAAKGGVVYRKRIRTKYIGTLPTYFACSFRYGKVVKLWTSRDVYQYSESPELRVKGRTATAYAYFNSCGAGATVDVSVDLETGQRAETDNAYEPEDIDECA